MGVLIILKGTLSAPKRYYFMSSKQYNNDVNSNNLNKFTKIKASESITVAIILLYS